MLSPTDNKYSSRRRRSRNKCYSLLSAEDIILQEELVAKIFAAQPSLPTVLTGNVQRFALIVSHLLLSCLEH